MSLRWLFSPVPALRRLGPDLMNVNGRTGTEMSTLYDGDDELHYCDNSHRWIAPPDVYPDVWEARVRAHLEEHLATMGGPPSRNQRRPLVPSQRRAQSRRNSATERQLTVRRRRTGTTS
jgi:hypothetical protein